MTMDVTTYDLAEAIDDYRDATFVIVALGEDDLNIRTAMDVRRMYQKFHYGDEKMDSAAVVPSIHVLVNDVNKSDEVRVLVNSQKVAYRLQPFGNVRDLYRKEVIINSWLDTLAYSVHCEYMSADDAGTRKSYDRSEYNRQSSMAVAMHLKYKLYAVVTELKEQGGGIAGAWDYAEKPGHDILNLYQVYITGQDVKEAERSDVIRERMLRLAMLEHNRWNAFMRSKGYVCASGDEVRQYYPVLNKHVHLLAGKHPCLVPWDKLDEVTRCVRELNPNATDFKEVDMILIDKISSVYDRAVKHFMDRET